MPGADPVDLIEIECFHCGAPFHVCVRDYRGQRYCDTPVASWVTEPAVATPAGGTRTPQTGENGTDLGKRPFAIAAA
jgi:hypothetical protein